jgi:hypothetical protein
MQAPRLGTRPGSPPRCRRPDSIEFDQLSTECPYRSGAFRATAALPNAANRLRRGAGEMSEPGSDPARRRRIRACRPHALGHDPARRRDAAARTRSIPERCIPSDRRAAECGESTAPRGRRDVGDRSGNHSSPAPARICRSSDGPRSPGAACHHEIFQLGRRSRAKRLTDDLSKGDHATGLRIHITECRRRGCFSAPARICRSSDGPRSPGAACHHEIFQLGRRSPRSRGRKPEPSD